MSHRNHMQGQKILFWDDDIGVDELGPLLRFFGLGQKLGQPQDFVRSDIPHADRSTLAKALTRRGPSDIAMGYPGGDVLMGYFGWANCRICGEKLGTCDLFGYGFIWPERAEHYILSHLVWTAGCDEMLQAVRAASTGSRFK
jgi:hypothetical protein